jgi:hypothetical protein
MTWKTTGMSYAVHLDHESPVFGESVTHVRIDDEAAGPYIVISQTTNPEAKPGEVAFELEQLEQVLMCARRLMGDVE